MKAWTQSAPSLPSLKAASATRLNCVDFEQRRKYAELNLRLRGLLTDPELDGGKPPDSITVNFVHVATLQEA
jgi:hypothetical protein